mmetsp:Transcript_6253/g.9356  ORF Transcript_6253/g.9356 Transcript_6253/m.9356 type:complete len:211 (-) Transcript_6253:369-1001(-)
MPPASPLATFELRMASKSEVLPWSTCPMIVTIGERGTNDSIGSSSIAIPLLSTASTIVSSLSIFCLTTFFPKASATLEPVSASTDCVTVAITPILIIMYFTSSAGLEFIFSANSATVIVGVVISTGISTFTGIEGLCDLPLPPFLNLLTILVGTSGSSSSALMPPLRMNFSPFGEDFRPISLSSSTLLVDFLGSRLLVVLFLSMSLGGTR